MAAPLSHHPLPARHRRWFRHPPQPPMSPRAAAPSSPLPAGAPCGGSASGRIISCSRASRPQAGRQHKGTQGNTNLRVPPHEGTKECHNDVDDVVGHDAGLDGKDALDEKELDLPEPASHDTTRSASAANNAAGKAWRRHTRRAGGHAGCTAGIRGDKSPAPRLPSGSSRTRGAQDPSPFTTP